MKQSSFFLYLFPVFLLSCSFIEKKKPEFEGLITYSIHIESKSINISSDSLQELYGNTLVIYFKDGNYKMQFNGTDIREIYYLKNENKQYSYRNNIDTLLVNDCGEEKRSLLSSEILDTRQIMGIKCGVLVLDLGKTKSTYCFAPEFYINPENYAQHVFGYMNVYYEKTKSVFLEYYYEGQYFNLRETAIKVEPQKLNKLIFELPKFPVKKW